VSAAAHATAETPACLLLAPLWLEARALRRGAPGAAVRRTGMGPRRSARAAAALAAEPAGALAVAGVGGALDASLAPGDLVVATELRGPDGVRGLPEAPALRRALTARGLAARMGPIRCVEHVVGGRERARLARGGALLVDMESAWLLPAADDRPAAVLRAVLDGPGRELFRPARLADLRRALHALTAAAPALRDWAAAAARIRTGEQ